MIRNLGSKILSSACCKQRTGVICKKSHFLGSYCKFRSAIFEANVSKIHTSPVRRLNPVLLALFQPLSKFAALMTGRSIRMWYKKLPEEQKAKLRAKARLNMKVIIGSGMSFGILIGYLYSTHIETCPITKRRRFMALKDNQIEEIAKREFKQLLDAYEGQLVPETHPVYNQVARVGNRVLRASRNFEQLGNKSWTVTVVEDPTKNAFVLPSGNIFVFTGMLEVCSNDDQLGIVLSHEIAHCLIGHVAEKISYANFINVCLLIPLALLWALLPNDGIAIISDWFFKQVINIMIELPFSRQMETEADEVGLQLAATACFDVREAPAFWGKMALLEGTEEMPELISTHPTHESRQNKLLSLLPTALAKRSECGCSRLTTIDPNVEFSKRLEG